MSPAKSPGSSRRKGKAVAFDPPVVSEEVDRSDSERSVEEEAERDPNGECAPLIDPWYETSPYFLKAPGKYVPPPPGRVLITLVRRDPDVSWAPLASSIPDLSIRQGISLPVPLHFEFGSGASLVGRSGSIANFPTPDLWVYCNGLAF